MGKVIGAASEFYRLRVSRIDVTDEPDLDWRDDILYREPPAELPAEDEDWCLEAVLMEEDTSVEIARFTEEDQAHSLMEVVQEDLDAMTISAFKERYLSQTGSKEAPADSTEAEEPAE